MANWTLGGASIPPPQTKTVKHDVQAVTHRTIDGSYTKDYIGSEKKVFSCLWTDISIGDYNNIIAKYNAQRLNGTAQNLTISDLGFSANVIIEVQQFELHIPGHYDFRKLAVIFYEQ